MGSCGTDAERAEIIRIWEAQEKELRELKADDIFQYLSDDVLEIKRVQYISEYVPGKGSQWVVEKYILVTGTGGPHVEFDTNHRISVYWGGDSWEEATTDFAATSVINEIARVLDESFP
jgi:hypothetical protein